MPTTTVRLQTPHASKYLQQLCKHFAHKVPVDYDAAAGEVAFPFGQCRMAAAGDVLEISGEVEREDLLPRMEAVIADHLTVFAFREALSYDWRRDAGKA